MNHYLKKISNLPVNKILAPGIEFRRDRRRQGFQIRVEGEVVWDFPRDFMDDPADSANSWGGSIGDTMWHGFHMEDLYSFLKSYLDTPRAQLEDFDRNYVGLREILMTADRRRGRHVCFIFLFTSPHPVAMRIYHHRFGSKKRAHT